jgi:hypothetical protein
MLKTRSGCSDAYSVQRKWGRGVIPAAWFLHARAEFGYGVRTPYRGVWISTYVRYPTYGTDRGASAFAILQGRIFFGAHPFRQ